MEESKSSEGKKHSLKSRTEALVREMLEKGIYFDEARKEFEKSFVCVALDMTKHNQCKAAKILGLHRNTLQSKMRLLGLNNNKTPGGK